MDTPSMGYRMSQKSGRYSECTKADCLFCRQLFILQLATRWQEKQRTLQK